MAILNWRSDNNKSVTDLIREESQLFVVILYQDDMQRANIMSRLRQKLGGSVQDSSLWGMRLRNSSEIRVVPLQRSQIELKGISISLLLFPDSVEYNIKQQITRELYPQLIRDGGIIGSVGSIRI